MADQMAKKARQQKALAPRVSGDNSLRDPPVPIPNTEVKPQHADSTWLETARKGRSSPDHSESHSKEWLSFLVETGKSLSRDDVDALLGGGVPGSSIFAVQPPCG